MQNFGIGTPLSVQWHLTKPDGKPFSLAGYTYTLKYRAGRGSGVARSTNVLTDADGNLSNIIVWNFTGGEQVATGVYDLELTIYRSGRKLCQSTYLGAFSLEKHIQKYPGVIQTTSREADLHGGPRPGDDNMPPEYMNTVELFSAAEWWMYKPLEPVASSNGYWYVNGQEVRDDNGNMVPTTYGVRYDEQEQCLVVYVGVYGEESYLEIQKITDIADMLTYAKETFDANETERQQTFEAAEEKRQENENKRIEKFEELEAFVRAATEQIATADTLQGSWYRSNTPIRLSSNTIISIKVKGSAGYALMNSNFSVIASSDGNDDLVYATSSTASTANYYVASKSQGEIIEYKLMVVADKGLQDSITQIEDLVRLGYKVSVNSVSPSSVDGAATVEVKASLVGFNGVEITPDKVTYFVGTTPYDTNKVPVPGATAISIVMTKGGYEFKGSANVTGNKTIYWGVGDNAKAVQASGSSWKTGGTTASRSAGYPTSSSSATGQFFFFLIPSGITTPASPRFKLNSTDGQELACSEVKTGDLPAGYKVFKSNREIGINQSFTVYVV